MRIYELFKKERKLRKMSKRNLSALTGISVTTISLFESGKRDIGYKKLADLCEKLGLELKIIL